MCFDIGVARRDPEPAERLAARDRAARAKLGEHLVRRVEVFGRERIIFLHGLRA